MVCNQSPGMIDWLLELGAARVARPVLRGGGGSDITSLPNQIEVHAEKNRDLTRMALLASSQRHVLRSTSCFPLSIMYAINGPNDLCYSHTVLCIPQKHRKNEQ